MMEQRSAEWHQHRAGKVTASRIADIMARTKTGPGAARKNYAAELVVERLTGCPREGFRNAAMQWGTDIEPQARTAYEFMHDAEVVEVGFIDHPTIADAGCSPDGLVGDDGMVEIKCPNTATHIDTLLSGEIDGKYIKQMMFQMACAGRAWCDFISYDPRLPAEMQLFVQRVQRDDEAITEIETAVREFLAEVSATVEALRARYMEDAA
ncbi:endonuclease [Paracoccus phage Shpa]|uniref:Endonuclease n=1 Tax=Paracoccus phage Shpa TaxID=1647282 RepID=A0A0U2BXF3_9CAUD|nr:exonuclease [Paracoccus phage Shpa]AKG94550.1 endonuclease [Paracoccus phage Shpa]